jgi:hypothetical protein
MAKFDNIGGLKVRAPVKSAGVVVGRVTDIRFDNESFEAVVSMSVDRRFEFPKDTSARILTSGFSASSTSAERRRRHGEPQGRRHVKNYPVGAGPREPDRTVPLQ